MCWTSCQHGLMLGACVYQSFFAMRCCAWRILSVSVVLGLESQYFWWKSRMIVGLYGLWRRQCSCCGQWFYYLHRRLPYICYFSSYYYYWWWVSVVCHIYFKHWIVLHFPPLFVTANLGGVETYFLQTVVAAAECYFHVRNTVATGFGAVADVDVVLPTFVGSALRIVLC